MKFLVAIAVAFLPLTPVAQTQTFSSSSGDVKITPLYHASVLIQAAGKTIYVDPVKPVKSEGLPKADLILITHEHYDHFDPEMLKALSTPDTTVFAPASVAAKYKAAKALSNGETRAWGAWTIAAVPAYNLVRGPAAGQLFHPKGRDNGYVLSFGGKRFYFSSDTENIPEMRALQNIDVALVCMNLPYTMPVEEAAAAVRAFHPRVVIPYHYKGQDLNVFKSKLAGTGIEVRLLEWYPQ